MKLGIQRFDFPGYGYFSIFVFIGFLGTAMGMGWSYVGLALCLTCGVTASGALFGFLFGIPRVLQRNGKNQETDQSHGAVSNTNLEQVSDWLTAIIIGASLVQLREIGAGLDWLSTKVAIEFSEGSVIQAQPIRGYALAYFAILYFFIGGFIFTYLFTRINLVQMFSDVEKKIQQAVSAAHNLSTERDLLLNQVGRVLSGASRVKMLRPTVEGDQNKGMFGGLSERNGRILSARIKPMGEDSGLCQVDISVCGTSAKHLSGKVTIHLHETFKPNDKVDVIAVDNKASLTTIAYGAFTVGVIADNGQTRLELDLADPNLGGPDDWRAR